MNGQHQPGGESVQAQRDQANARAMEAWQLVAELREGLRALLKEYIAERDSLYDGVTNSEGEYDHPDDRRVVEEMDAVIDAATKLLTRPKP